MDTETELNEQDHSRLRFPHHEDTEGLADRTAILHPHHHRHDGQLTLLASEGENPMTDSTAWNLGDSSDGDGLIDFLFTLREHPRNRPSSPTDSLYNNYDSNSGGESMTSSIVSTRVTSSATSSLCITHAGGRFMELTDRP